MLSKLLMLLTLLLIEVIEDVEAISELPRSVNYCLNAMRFHLQESVKRRVNHLAKQPIYFIKSYRDML